METEMTYYQNREIVSKKQVIEKLVERDGYRCMFPGCVREFDEVIDPETHYTHMMTIDHIHPQAAALEAGWEYELVNDIDNLQLMGKSCNARKGDLIPNPDGTLPVRPSKPASINKPDVCDHCMSGRLLLADEVCEVCGSGPQPVGTPRYLQKKPKDCDHNVYHCWMCHLGFIERQSAAIDVFGPPPD
jgi:5-methylcytosine-specific restriction endonuclease McrA